MLCTSDNTEINSEMVGNALIARVKSDLHGKSTVGSGKITESFTNSKGLLYLIEKFLKDLMKSRSNLIDKIQSLCTQPQTKDIKEVASCCLRPDTTDKNLTKE